MHVVPEPWGQGANFVGIATALAFFAWEDGAFCWASHSNIWLKAPQIPQSSTSVVWMGPPKFAIGDIVVAKHTDAQKLVAGYHRALIIQWFSSPFCFPSHPAPQQALLPRADSDSPLLGFHRCGLRTTYANTHALTMRTDSHIRTQLMRISDVASSEMLFACSEAVLGSGLSRSNKNALGGV